MAELVLFVLCIVHIICQIKVDFIEDASVFLLCYFLLIVFLRLRNLAFFAREDKYFELAHISGVARRSGRLCGLMPAVDLSDVHDRADVLGGLLREGILLICF